MWLTNTVISSTCKVCMRNICIWILMVDKIHLHMPCEKKTTYPYEFDCGGWCRCNHFVWKGWLFQWPLVERPFSLILAGWNSFLSEQMAGTLYLFGTFLNAVRELSNFKFNLPPVLYFSTAFVDCVGASSAVIFCFYKHGKFSPVDVQLTWTSLEVQLS